MRARAGGDAARRHRDQSATTSRRSSRARRSARAKSPPAFCATLRVISPRTIEVLDGGTQTTVQDYPGRIGYWEVGVPPSGPMDALAFRLANRLVGNDEARRRTGDHADRADAAFQHRRRRSASPARRCARSSTGQPVPFWEPVQVQAGQTLVLGALEGAGCRTYLAVRGGLDVPDYLGSRATFTLGNSAATPGGRCASAMCCKLRHRRAEPLEPQPLAARRASRLHERLGNRRALRPARRAGFLHAGRHRRCSSPRDWKVHYNSARTGVRLVGPKPQWARQDGGEAGLHPSNIHDNAYAIGAIDFTGDMPIILGPDGPSLGGFVCPAVIVQAELWKIGPAQARRHACAFAACTRSAKPPRSSRTQDRDARGLSARPRRRASAQRVRLARSKPRSCFGCPPRDGAPAIVYRRGGRQISAGRIRPAGARPRAALPRPRADDVVRAARAARASSISRPASARCRSTTIRACCRARELLRRSCSEAERALFRATTSRCRRASCICRSRGTIRRRASRSRNT